MITTEQAIGHFGSASALAAALGVTVQAVSQWGEFVPQQRQYELERITNGALRADWPQQPALGAKDTT